PAGGGIHHRSAVGGGRRGPAGTSRRRGRVGRRAVVGARRSRSSRPAPGRGPGPRHPGQLGTGRCGAGRRLPGRGGRERGWTGMNILVLCPHFAPDVAPTGEVMTQIADGLVARGHRLHVVTSLPWYQHHAIEPGWGGQVVRHEDVGWGRITRVHPFPTDKRNVPARALAFAGFTALSGLAGLLSRARPAAVLAMSPP